MIKKLLYFKPKFIILAATFACLNCGLAVGIPYHDSQNSYSLSELNLDEEEPLPTDPEISDEAFEFSSSLIIKAINPGYKINGEGDVGELIELQNLSDAPISLAGISLRYTNGSGKKITLLNFSEGSILSGEYLLARYKKSPDVEQADITYTTSLALGTGSLELLLDDEIIDSVCWTGKSDCHNTFKSAKPTTLVRNFITGEFEHLEEYDTHYDETKENLILPTVEDPPADSEDTTVNSPQCFALEFSEIFTYYADDKSEQFIELFNPSNQTVNLNGCALLYKKKAYPLSGTIPAQGHYAYYPNENFSLTKNPTSSNQVDLVDTDGQVVAELVYAHGQKKSMSYAKFYNSDGSENWAQTYALTPGEANLFQDQRTCPAGKVTNPLTGNCVNITSTNSTTECPAGKYRNPLTGRCKNITDSSTSKDCAEGYERNPETNRCRKIKSTNDGADFALVPKTGTSKTTFIAFGIVIFLVSLGILYIVWQFRREIARAGRKARQSLHHFLEHGFSRKSRGNGDKET